MGRRSKGCRGLGGGGAAPLPAPGRAAAAPVIVRAKNIDQTVVLLRNFLSAEEIATLCRLGPSGQRQEHDRSDELDFHHAVWRCEQQLDADGGAKDGSGSASGS